ncbi:tetratricopeptide repeat protein 19 homolog, mitochondrial [Ceratina calcarata]|uniref:Tetratricopeptide repeat protein 19 homolog, mitochondrial n=1 Tax=Ceratina calcarata TaxID=156304 RepID=A0AAJ7J223_9HYME|nr:tetratricopeptide repeat protein 19 homolog, mitochondrial [Ceratina calcarata]
MQCLKMVLDTFKYTRTITKSLYAANVRLSNQRRNIFNRHLEEISRIKKNNSNSYQWKNPSRTTFFVISGSFLFNLFKPKEERERDDIEELTMTIKRSILLIQKQEFPKAEQMLHIALRQAQTLQHYDGITYIYDIMANLAYDLNDFKKAETLFKFVLSRLLAKKVPEDDLSVIHISLKIADIYDKTGDTKKAESGYKFCLEHLQNHLAKDSENVDVLQLLGLTLEKYATMLFTKSQYTNALNYFTQAYDISVKINGEANEQSVILLNDLGSVSHMLQKYDQAIGYLSKAAEFGKKLPDMGDLGSIYVNLGNALIAKGLYEEAEKRCKEGERLAKARDDKESINEAKKCLQQIKDLTS